MCSACEDGGLERETADEDTCARRGRREDRARG